MRLNVKYTLKLRDRWRNHPVREERNHLALVILVALSLMSSEELEQYNAEVRREKSDRPQSA
jgi:hypothetical protein